jgi:threonine synthase
LLPCKRFEGGLYESIPIYEQLIPAPTMIHTTELICSKCRAKSRLEAHYSPCRKCGGQLLLYSDLDAISKKVTKRTFEHRAWGVWRYRELLPDIEQRKIVSLGEGGTALLKCARLAQTLGIRSVLIKDETTNPTGSFIDRGMTVEISRANELGFRTLGCQADSGNFAASASAYAARAGLNCAIHWLRRRVEEIDLGKLYQMIAYGGNIVVDSNPVTDQESNDAVEKSYRLTPSDPFFAEGEKTAAYEICEQLGWRTPDRIMVPMGHGENLSMIWRGINELRKVGLINKEHVSMSGVQLEGYSGIVDKLQGRKVADVSLGKAKTVAVELAMKQPTHGYLAIRSIRESGGEGVKVKDAEVFGAIALLARTEGIFAEPAAAATIAGLKKLVDDGRANRNEEIVCVITGAGLKDPNTARRFITKVKQVDRILSQIESRRFTTRVGGTKLKMLKIISEKETYGYEIWSKLKERGGLDLDISSVYQHLSELERVGLIRRSRAERVLGKPERNYYSITDRGKALSTSPEATD